MNILLIQPRMLPRPMDTSLKARMSPSLALLTLATLTPAPHTVTIVNENVEKIDFNAPVDLVGITVTVDVMNRAVGIARAFQRRRVPVVAGGIHITACPQQAALHFDAVAVGLAERVWGRILADVENHALQKIYHDMANITGDEIAPPAYERMDSREYLYTNIISTSRGCPFACDFCYNSCEHMRGVYLRRPVDDVVEEIRAMGTRHVMFIDDNFIGDPAWTLELLAKIRPLRLKWNAAVSANLVDRPDLLDAMRDAGCQSLFIGFESISKKSLEGVHKRQNDIDRYERLVREIHGRGIMINASFVFGLEGDDASTFAATLDWIVRNRIETVTSHILTPYPGTRLYDRLACEGRITDRDLSHYNTAHVVFRPVGMTAEELYSGYLWIYKQVYSFGNILRRMPRSRGQVLPYLLFSLLYRKFGRFSAVLCRIFSFSGVGRFSRRMSYRVK